MGNEMVKTDNVNKSFSKKEKLKLSHTSGGYWRKVARFFVVLILLVTISAFMILETLGVFTIGGIIKLLFGFCGVLIGALFKTFKDLVYSAPWETHLTRLIFEGQVGRDTKVRISYATAVIIELNGKYLLPFDERMKLYVLPASIYEITKEEEFLEGEKFAAIRDEFVTRDVCDYRFQVPVKNVKRFYKHFDKTVDPYSYNRKPIIDRIVNLCGLDPKKFEKVNIKPKCRHIWRVEKKRYTACYEMNLMDVFEIDLSAEQRLEMEEAMKKKVKSFKFVDKEEISHNGVDKRNGKYVADIMPTTYDILKAAGYDV